MCIPLGTPARTLVGVTPSLRARCLALTGQDGARGPPYKAHGSGRPCGTRAGSKETEGGPLLHKGSVGVSVGN